MPLKTNPASRFATVLALVGLIMAGCSARPAPLAEPGTPETAGPAQFDPNTCGISGRVVSDELMPIVNALVAILALNRTTQSAADGSYALSHVPAGNFSLVVQAAGYDSMFKSIKCLGGELLTLAFTLESIPLPAEPFAQELGFRTGQIGCSARVLWQQAGNDPCTTYDITPDSRPTVQFKEIPRGNVTGMVMEMEWQKASAVGSDRLRLTATKPNEECAFVTSSGTFSYGPTSISVRGKSPIRLQVNSTDPANCPLFDLHKAQAREHSVTASPDGPGTLNAYIADPTQYQPVELAHSVDFTVHYTLFYHGEPIPDQYSHLG